ncbi:MAG: LytTR family DNA-binding domain-containing protein [Bacteroidales bacterium]
MKIRAVIIDDERHSRATLKNLLNEFCQNIEVVAQADGFKSGVKAIKEQQPDLVFLDIQMPDGNGFRVLEETQQSDFDVIFTTAYDNFAIKAFKYSALDYLLKPIDAVELQNSVDKVKTNKQRNAASNPGIDLLLKSIREQEKPEKLVLSTFEGMHVVEIQDIIRCQSDDYYTRFFFKNGHKILVSKTLKEYEQILSEHQFIRPHKSHLVNIKYIKSYIKADGGHLLLTDDTQVPVSRRKKEMVLHVLNSL